MKQKFERYYEQLKIPLAACPQCPAWLGFEFRIWLKFKWHSDPEGHNIYMYHIKWWECTCLNLFCQTFILHIWYVYMYLAFHFKMKKKIELNNCWILKYVNEWRYLTLCYTYISLNLDSSNITTQDTDFLVLKIQLCFKKSIGICSKLILIFRIKWSFEREREREREREIIH